MKDSKTAAFITCDQHQTKITLIYIYIIYTDAYADIFEQMKLSPT